VIRRLGARLIVFGVVFTILMALATLLGLVD
jgi:hypothetical protein